MEKEVVERLIEIKKRKYDFSYENKEEIVDLCFASIGDINSDIRDNLVYPILVHLFHDHQFSEDELTRYLKKLMSNDFLLFDLDNKKPYSVLTRSFSILQLVVLVYIHQRDHIIDQTIIEDLFDRFIQYFKQETILTGYDQKVGWVHAIAHSADLFSEFMQVEWFTENRLIIMFDAIASKIKQGNHFFMFNEDERLVTSIKKGLERNILSKEYLTLWIHQFSEEHEFKSYPQKMIYENNIKCFLRSLYFGLINDSKFSWITEEIKSIVTK